MANSLHLSREVKVYVKFDSLFWEIPVLDGLSFSQGTNITEVTLAEMADSSNQSRRARMAYNDSLSPAEWSFSTYARPTVVSSDHRCPEEILWALMAGAKDYDAADAGGDIFDNGAATPVSVINSDGTDMNVSFAGSNLLTLGDAEIYFNFPGNGGTAVWYKITGAVVNEASMDFDLDGITTINWSGFGTKLSEVDPPTLGTPLAHNLTDTANFIRNRLTQLVLDPTDDQGGASGPIGNDPYNLVLTGGNITISNGIEFITPSSLGIVNEPIGHVTGTRSVTGSFTCYLDQDSRASADLFSNLAAATSVVTNEFALTFKVGGSSATPRVEVAVPQAMLEIPSHSVEDVISVEVNFHGLPTGITKADEVNLTYVGQAPA